MDQCSQKDASGCSGEGDQVAFGDQGETNAGPEAPCSLLPNRIPLSSTPHPSTMTAPCLSLQLQVMDVVSVHNGKTTQKSYLASLGSQAP